MQSFSLSPLTVHFLDWQAGVKFYDAVMAYWFYVRESLAMSWVEVRYEDVLNDMEGQFSPIFKMLGLEWASKCENFYKHAQSKEIGTPSFDQVTKPIYMSSVNRWQNYEKFFESKDM